MDPALAALRDSAPVAGLLRLREQLMGSSAAFASPVYHPAGDVYLIRCVDASDQRWLVHSHELLGIGSSSSRIHS
jgi:hypothetical protein